MKKIILSTILLFTIISIYAQRGKDGVKTITATEVVNAFTMLTSNASIGDTLINVINSNLNSNFSSTLSAGDLIMIYQVQGVSIEDTIPAFWPDPLFGNSSKFFSTWGRITNYNNAGNYEFVQVKNVPNATSIVFDCALQKNYTSTGRVLIVRVPRFSSLTINNGGVLTTTQWNGTSGGVIAIEILGVTNINVGGSIDASGLGFRGGIGFDAASVFGGARYADANVNEGAQKGEGIAGDPTIYATFNDGGAKQCRGAAANAGGGGNAHNAGGGGGSNSGTLNNWNNGVGNPDISTANYITAWNLETSQSGLSSATTSSGGGRGGYSFSSTDKNELTVAPGNSGWGGDYRKIVGGLGGRPLDYSTGKLFMGGAGGAGEGNDNEAGNGGDGGGLIFLRTYNSITGAGNIISNGADGGDVIGVSPPAGQVRGKDGAGGAGAGGTIVLQTTSTVSLTGNINANGGIGGDQVLAIGSFGSTEAEGPGGGGGGGYISITSGAPIRTTNGGANGVTNCSHVVQFPPNGATKGGTGTANGTINSFDLTASNATICTNNTATLTASYSGTTPVGASIEWYDAAFGGNLLQTGASFTTPILSAQTTYYVKSCPGTFTVPVTVFINACGVPPVTSLSSSDSIFCIGSCINFSDLSTNTPSSWTWHFFGSNTLISNLQNPTNICYNSAGTFGVALVSTNPSGSDSLFIPNFITVNALPIIITSPDTSICIGASVNLTATGGSTYLWNNGLGVGQSHTDNPTIPTTYTVYVTDVNLCFDSAQIDVAINNLPSIITSVDTTICTGNAVNLSVSGGSTYFWDNGLGAGQNHAPTPLITTTYHVTGTDINLCINTDSVVVTVGVCGLAPVSSFGTPDSSVCIGSCLSFNDLSTNLPSSWTWYFFGSDSLKSNVQNPTNICYNTAGNFNVALVTSNAFGTDSLYLSNFIHVFNLPIIITSPDTIVCMGSPVNLSANGASSYVWDNGLVVGQNQSPTPFIPTTYTVTGTDINNCSNSASINVSIFSLPTITTSPDTIVCIGDTIKLRANGALTYSWDSGIGNFQNPNILASNDTLYNVIGTDLNGCSASAQVQVVINSLPIITASNDTQICKGDTTTISASGGAFYSWDNGVGFVQSKPVFPAATTTYTVTGGNLLGCRNTDQVVITVNLLPTIIASNDVSICLGDTTTISAVGGLLYTWNNGIGAGQNAFVFPSSTTTYTVVGTDGNFCKNSDQVVVTVNNCTTPTVNFNTSNTIICMNNCIDFVDSTTSISPIVAWNWSFIGANPSTSTDQNPINICYNNAGIFNVSLVVTNAIGKDSLFLPNYIVVDSCNTTIIPEPVVVISNVFTPNVDGKNDLFIVSGDGVKTVGMKIYNRWGQIVFETSQKNQGWDGRTNSGKKVPEGTYFYIIDVETTGKTKTYTGSLTLLR